MFVKPHQFFKRALAENWAIGAFNFSNLEVAQGILAAANNKKSPVIIQTSEGAIEYGGLNVLSAMAKALAEKTDIPVILHLDHGKNLEIAKQCIEAGYGSVMIDLSKENFEENIAITKQVIDYAHARGVWVEAELGAILGKEGVKDLHGEKTPDSFLTDPLQVKEFTEKTGVDALAVSVGTIHGAFSGQEYIRFELLEKIQTVVPHLPLVLHGASGIPNDHLKKACTMNVCKVNVDTEIRIAFEKAVQAYFTEEHTDVDPRKILGPARDAVQRVVEEKISMFGSSNKI